MPQRRQYANDAERKAAWRKRQERREQQGSRSDVPLEDQLVQQAEDRRVRERAELDAALERAAQRVRDLPLAHFEPEDGRLNAVAVELGVLHAETLAIIDDERWREHLSNMPLALKAKLELLLARAEALKPILDAEVQREREESHAPRVLSEGDPGARRSVGG